MSDKDVKSKASGNRSLAYRRYLRHVQADKNNKCRTSREQSDTKEYLSAVTSMIDKSEDIAFPNVSKIVNQYNAMHKSGERQVTPLRQFSSCHDIVFVEDGEVINKESESDDKNRLTTRENSGLLLVPKSQGYLGKSYTLTENGKYLWRTRSQPNLFTRESLNSLETLESEISDEGYHRDISCENSITPSPPNFSWSERPTFLGLDSISTSTSPAFSLASSAESVEDISYICPESSDNLRLRLRSTASSDSAVCVEDDAFSCNSSPPTQSGREHFINRRLSEGVLPFKKSHKKIVTSRGRNPRTFDMNEICHAKKESFESLNIGAEDKVFLRENPGRSVIRTPSVIITDYSSTNVTTHVEIEPNEISIDHDNKKNDIENVNFDSVRLRKTSCGVCSRQAQSVFNCLCSSRVSCTSDGATRHAKSEYSGFRKLSDCSICLRKLSDCSTCSSLSTLDMNATDCTGALSVGFEWSKGDQSDCSSCSYLTASEDEAEVEICRPPPPVKKMTSNWRKVRNVVQWTPFIQTYKRHKYPWVQLAGHQGNFKAGYKQGTILKKLCPAEENALETIKKDVLRPYVPDYMGVVESSDGEKYLQLQDLLSGFSSPCVMDIKMGVRTYLEEELAKARHKPKLRKDMFEKMVQINPDAPTEAEHKAKAVTKPRYMVWRETISSTATFGFRIEGVRRGDGTSTKDFKTTRTREQVLAVLEGFIEGYPQSVPKYIQRLKAIQATLECSNFFHTHELIGSSLLFVHNEDKAGVWLIDFAKTVPLPNSVHVTHKCPWVEGTHEDGYLIGLGNLIDLLEKYCQSDSPKDENKLANKEGDIYDTDSESKHKDESKDDRLRSTTLADQTPQRGDGSNRTQQRFEPSPKNDDSTSSGETLSKDCGDPSSLKTEVKNTPNDSLQEKGDCNNGRGTIIHENHFTKSSKSNNLTESFETKCHSFQTPKNAE